ncbi:MAG: hypothetical protein J6N76_10870, partial [Lachnospiraceae bacterium]|nr:hypothetical protein [Lachnospiraceae bacterium]
MEKELHIDLLLPQISERGGLDRIINHITDFAKTKNDISLRLIQMIDTGLKWWGDAPAPESLFTSEEAPTFMDAAVRYG